MRKILVIGVSDIYGGIETYMKNVVDNIDVETFKIDFLNVSSNDLAYKDFFISKGSKIKQVTGRKKNFFKYRREIIEFLKNTKYDVIHIHIMSFEAFERIFWSIKYTDAKIIVHSHSAGFGKNAKVHTRVLDKIGRFVLKDKEYKCVACGKDAGKWMFRKKDFIVANNGIDYEKYKFNNNFRSEIREMYGIKDNEIIIGHTGRIEKQKNHKLLINIFEEFRKNNSNSKLMIVGDGSLRKEIYDLAVDKNIINDVIFVGYTKDVHKYYSAFDVFCMPSLYEGLSISLVEAQFNGLKCYTSTSVDLDSDITGNVEFIGLNDSIEMWTKAIQKNNVRDKDVKMKIKTEYFIENSVKILEKIYSVME